MTSSPDLQSLAKAPYGVYAVDMEETIVSWNDGAQAILGHSAEETIGRRCYEVLQCRPENAEHLEATGECPAILLARENHTPPATDLSALCASGRRKLITATPVVINSEASGKLLVYLFREVNLGLLAVNSVAVKLAVMEAIRNVFPNELTLLQFASEDDEPAEDGNPLTSREIEVVRFLAAGKETQEIADELGLSLHTVRSHLANARNKLEARSKLDLVLAAQRMGLV